MQVETDAAHVRPAEIGDDAERSGRFLSGLAVSRRIVMFSTFHGLFHVMFHTVFHRMFHRPFHAQHRRRRHLGKAQLVGRRCGEVRERRFDSSRHPATRVEQRIGEALWESIAPHILGRCLKILRADRRALRPDLGRVRQGQPLRTGAIMPHRTVIEAHVELRRETAILHRIGDHADRVDAARA